MPTRRDVLNSLIFFLVGFALALGTMGPECTLRRGELRYWKTSSEQWRGLADVCSAGLTACSSMCGPAGGRP